VVIAVIVLASSIGDILLSGAMKSIGDLGGLSIAYAAYEKSIARLAALAPEVNTVLGAHNIPVAPTEVLPALVRAFADLQAGKATCKPAGSGKQLCDVDKFSFLLRAAP